MQILHCFSRSRKNLLLYSFKFHWSYYILFLVWWCASFKWRKNAHSFFCIISIFKHLDDIVVQCHLLWWIFQFLNLTLMHYRSAFSKIHKTSILVWLKIGPKERICPLFLDKKISPKNGLYFWRSYTQGSPVEFNLDYLGIF